MYQFLTNVHITDV